MRTIGIVGGGASGVVLATRLLREASEPLHLVMFEPRDELGLGIAYSTPDAQHLLNVPAIGMSAFSEDPEHFLRWAGVSPSSFVSRITYGKYLREIFHHARSTSHHDVTFEHVQARVIDVAGFGRPQVSTEDGRQFTFDDVVLAFGNRKPAIPGFVEPNVLQSERFIADPWSIDTTTALRNKRVLTIGTGLTFIDLSLTTLRRSRSSRITGISRHGLLPTSHSNPWKPPFLPPETLSAQPSPREVLRYIRSEGKYWRQGLDSLRGLNQSIWRGWTDDQKAQFVRHAARYWDVHRHRMAPEVSLTIKRYARMGRLTTHAADIANIDIAEKYISVHASDGRQWQGDVLVLCTGPDDNPEHDPLGARLIHAGLATPGPLGRGYAIDEHGRLPGTRIWTIGPVRRGALWESTAMPEIRAQAAELQVELLSATQVESATRPNR